MITFAQVSAEFRGLVERRRRHLSFLFSTMAAYSILADGALHGRLPKPIVAISGVILNVGAVSLMFLCFTTALREARIHKGLAYNGHLFQALSRVAGAEAWNSRNRPWRFNPFGVSATLFAISLLSGLGLLAFNCAVVGLGWAGTMAAMVATAACGGAYFWAQHSAGTEVAAMKLRAGRKLEHNRLAWRAHVAASIDDAHRDMLELIGLAGLVAFSGFQLLSGLGDAKVISVGYLQFSRVEESAPIWLSGYMVVITGLTIVSYVRLRFAVGLFSRALDPSDRPFRASNIDDSFYGFLILLSLIGLDLVLFLASAASSVSDRRRTIVVALIALAIIVCERFAMGIVGRRAETPGR